jgi:aryl-alcohol dehydrogenase-like predicted oxidoreductase
MDPAAFLLRFSLSNPSAHTILVGTGSVSHLTANVRSAEAGPLPADVHREVRRRLERVDSVPA